MNNIPELSRFTKHREKFYQIVKRSPVCCKVIYTSYDTEATGYDALVGNLPRTTVEKDLQCLYSRNFDAKTRSKYGLTENTTAVVHIDPQSLVDAFGTYRLDTARVKITLLGETYMCEKVMVNGDIPQYGFAVSVEFRLKDDIQG